MSYYSQQYSAWFCDPYPYPYPIPAPYNELPRDRSYATCPNMQRICGLPPPPTLDAPPISPLPVHLLMPDRTTISDLVRQGFQSVPAPHTYLRASGTLYAHHGCSLAHRTCTLHTRTGDVAHTAHGCHILPHIPLYAGRGPCYTAQHACTCTCTSSLPMWLAPLAYLTAVPAHTICTTPGPPTVLMAPPYRSHQCNLTLAHLVLGLSTPRPSVPSYLSVLGPPAVSLSVPDRSASHAALATSHMVVQSASELAPQLLPPSGFMPLGPPLLSSLGSTPLVLFFCDGLGGPVSATTCFFRQPSRASKG
jgi:hypothetical protein